MVCSEQVLQAVLTKKSQYLTPRHYGGELARRNLLAFSALQRTLYQGPWSWSRGSRLICICASLCLISIQLVVLSIVHGEVDLYTAQTIIGI